MNFKLKEFLEKKTELSTTMYKLNKRLNIARFNIPPVFVCGIVQYFNEAEQREYKNKKGFESELIYSHNIYENKFHKCMIIKKESDMNGFEILSRLKNNNIDFSIDYNIDIIYIIDFCSIMISIL